MIFIKRAFIYLKRKIGKTILLSFIFLVIANCIIAGLLIQNASENVQRNTRASIGADINYIFNYDEIFAEYEKGLVSRKEIGRIKGEGAIVTSEELSLKGAPSVSNINRVVESEYVQSYYYSLDMVHTVEDIIAYQVDAKAQDTNGFRMVLYGAEQPLGFADEVGILIEGRLPTAEEIEEGEAVAVIESTLADLNQLDLGDVLTVEFDNILNNVVELEVEIIGIYETQMPVVDFNYAPYFPQNTMYMPFNILMQVGVPEEDLKHTMVTEGVIRLEDPSNMELYRAEMDQALDLSYGTLDANDDLYESLVGPIESIGLITQIFVVSIILTGGFIIGLITALTINDRKSEIGILLAVGESKFKIVCQFVLEVVVIAIVAFSLSLVTGEILGDRMSETLLDSEVFGSVEGPAQIPRVKKVQPIKDISKIKESATLTIGLDLKIILQIFLIGTVLTVFSTAIPTLYVMRYSPKQILSARDS